MYHVDHLKGEEQRGFFSWSTENDYDLTKPKNKENIFQKMFLSQNKKTLMVLNFHSTTKTYFWDQCMCGCLLAATSSFFFFLFSFFDK